LRKARGFYKSTEFQQCMSKAGVIGEPEIAFMEELLRAPELVSV
jgi:hypothetical protein